MKASELIKLLEEQIQLKGDLDIIVSCSNGFGDYYTAMRGIDVTTKQNVFTLKDYILVAGNELSNK